jgi:hypothetical protein
MTAVASLCSRAVYLAGGKVNAIGTSSEMIDAYLGSQVSSSAFSPRHDHRSGDRRVMIDDFSISPGQLQTGQRATFEFHVSTGPHRDCFRLIVSPGGFAPGRIVGDHGYPVVVASTWELSHI